MVVNPFVLEKKLKTIDLARYYFKGFGTRLASATHAAEIGYRGSLEMRDSARRDCIAAVELLERLYGTIPFESIKGKSEYAPLFVMKDLLAEYKSAVLFLFSDGSERAYGRVRSLTFAIHEVGMVYRRGLEGMLNDIRSVSGEDDFRVRVVDQKGAAWYL
jgi:hypothetical protein